MYDFDQVISLLLVAVALADGQTEDTVLTGVVGRSLLLITGLQGIEEVLLHSDNHNLLHFENGKFLRKESERFQFEETNGSVIISPLNFNDSGEYVLQLTHVNNLVDTNTYTIIVNREYFLIILRIAM